MERVKLRVFKEGWWLFLAICLDAFFTWLGMEYVYFQEINPVLLLLQKYYGTFANVLLIKIFLSFCLIAFLCTFATQEAERATRRILKVVSIFYWLVVGFLLINLCLVMLL